MSDLAAIIFVQDNVTTETRGILLKSLASEQFVGCDHETGEYINLDLLFKKYPNSSGYSLRVDTEDLAISCSSDFNFINFSFDGDGDDPNKLRSAINKIIERIPNVQFAYIDFEGDPPKNIMKMVEKTNLTHMFRTNYYGKPFLEKYGLELFTQMPKANLENIGNIIRIDLVENISSSMSDSNIANLQSYLKKNGISAQIYNHANHFFD